MQRGELCAWLLQQRLGGHLHIGAPLTDAAGVSWQQAHMLHQAGHRPHSEQAKPRSKHVHACCTGQGMLHTTCRGLHLDMLAHGLQVIDGVANLHSSPLSVSHELLQQQQRFADSICSSRAAADMSTVKRGGTHLVGGDVVDQSADGLDLLCS